MSEEPDIAKKTDEFLKALGIVAVVLVGIALAAHYFGVRL